MDKETEEISYVNEEKVKEMFDDILVTIMSHFSEDGLDEQEMYEVFAALGMTTGALMNESFYVNNPLPYLLFGVLADHAHQTVYCSRYGLDMEELENSRQVPN